MTGFQPPPARLLVMGTLCLAAAVAILLTIDAGWLGRPLGLTVQVGLGGAFLFNLLGAWFFLRYFLIVLRRLRSGK